MGTIENTPTSSQSRRKAKCRQFHTLKSNAFAPTSTQSGPAYAHLPVPTVTYSYTGRPYMTPSISLQNTARKLATCMKPHERHPQIHFHYRSTYSLHTPHTTRSTPRVQTNAFRDSFISCFFESVNGTSHMPSDMYWIVPRIPVRRNSI